MPDAEIQKRRASQHWKTSRSEFRIKVENEFEKLERRSKATSSAMLCASKLPCVRHAHFMGAIS